MRQIKFRAWDIKNKKWVDHNGLLSDTSVSVSVGDMPILSFEHEDWVFMQFTCLLDKHGEEIYEGDIIMPVEKRYPFYDEGKPNYVGTIEWCFAGFHCVLNLVGKGRYGISDGMNEPFEEGEWCEVIGNVYENPDLLEVK